MTNYNWATYRSATGCTQYGPAGCKALQVYLEDIFPSQSSYGICNCRNIVGGSSYSHHAECRAYDEGFAVFVGQLIGVHSLQILGPHGARLGIDHMIVNHDPGASDRGDPRVYSDRSPQGRVYTGTHPHKNHNHIGLTRSAGRNLTYATLVTVVGTPTMVRARLFGITGDDDMLIKRGDPKTANCAEAQKMMAEKFGVNNGSWAPFPGRSIFDQQSFAPGEDGDPGSTFESNVKIVQGKLGQPQTGVVDQRLWDALVFHRYQSSVTSVDLSGLATKTSLAAVDKKLSDHVGQKLSGPHN